MTTSLLQFTGWDCLCTARANTARANTAWANTGVVTFGFLIKSERSYSARTHVILKSQLVVLSGRGQPPAKHPRIEVKEISLEFHSPSAHPQQKHGGVA